MNTSRPLRFKPLWLIHNATYRQLKRSGRKALMERYRQKLTDIICLKLHIRR